MTELEFHKFATSNQIVGPSNGQKLLQKQPAVWSNTQL
jgi:hypothetical protein